MKIRTGSLRTATFSCLLMVGLPIGLAGCAAAGEDPAPAPVPAKTISAGVGERSATLQPGEELVVDLGEINSSVGLDWEVVTEPDPAVLSAGERVAEYLGQKDSVGGPSSLEYRFTAVEPGETVVEFEYRFRGEIPDGKTEPQIAHLEVAVEK